MFAQLTLVVAAGIIGPILSSSRRALLPVVIGELAAGVALGNTGLHAINASAGVLPAFHAVGFAMLMLVAGTHVDLRSAALRQSAPRAALALLIVGLLAAPTGLLLANVLGVGHALLLGVLLAGSSAAVVFPIIEERDLTGPSVAFLMAWISVADAVTVVLMPLALGGGGNLVRVLLGDALLFAIGIGLLSVADTVTGKVTSRLVARSLQRGWALQVRLSMLLLLALAAVSEGTGGSSLVAGFLAGIVLVRWGEPDRLQIQLTGLANGFFVPIFFVTLGAQLDLRALVADPAAIGLAVALAVAAVGIHVGAGMAAGKFRRLATGLAGSAQLGLPAAAASIGLATHTLSPALAAAVVAAGCLTLVPATVGAELLASTAGT